MELPQDRRAFGLEELDQVPDDFAVVLFADAVAAGSGALVNAVKQARAEKPPLVVGGANLQATGAKPKDLLEDHHHGPQVVDGRERPEEAAAAIAGIAGDVHAGKFLPRGDLQIREGLVIDQVGVVRRADVLDQPGLLQDGLDLAGGLKVIDRLDFVDHLDDLGAPRGQQVAGGLKVVGHTTAKIEGLADIQDGVVGGLHEVQTGGRGKRLDRLPNPVQPIWII